MSEGNALVLGPIATTLHALSTLVPAPADRRHSAALVRMRGYRIKYAYSQSSMNREHSQSVITFFTDPTTGDLEMRMFTCHCNRTSSSNQATVSCRCSQVQ